MRSHSRAGAALQLGLSSLPEGNERTVTRTGTYHVSIVVDSSRGLDSIDIDDAILDYMRESPNAYVGVWGEQMLCEAGNRS